jgi:folate-dependent tRNA-U54 methylase TrmFO/GidA
VNIVKAKVHIIGGRLAGCEAAWQVARAGGQAVLYEMRRAGDSGSETDALAELVCSNSLERAGKLAPWLLRKNCGGWVAADRYIAP